MFIFGRKVKRKSLGERIPRGFLVFERIKGKNNFFVIGFFHGE
jgi:hypothetical protein